MTKTMLCENSLPKNFWIEAINTTCYVQNKILTRPLIIKKKLLMNYEEEEDSTFHAFIPLDVSALSQRLTC